MPLIASAMLEFTLTSEDIHLIKEIADCGCMKIEDLTGIAHNSSVTKLSALGFIKCDSKECCISEMIRSSLSNQLREKNK